MMESDARQTGDETEKKEIDFEALDRAVPILHLTLITIALVLVTLLVMFAATIWFIVEVLL